MSFELKTPTTGELAKMLDLPYDKIEVVFVNGLANSMDYPVKPGDRVAFMPPAPGPYRVFLGFVQKRTKHQLNMSILNVLTNRTAIVFPY